MAEWSSWFGLALAILATWRLSHLVALEDGPFDLILQLRAAMGDGHMGRLMDCPYCLSLWIAMPFALVVADRMSEWSVAWLAISGGASIIERLVAGLAATTRSSVGKPPEEN